MQILVSGISYIIGVYSFPNTAKRNTNVLQISSDEWLLKTIRNKWTIFTRVGRATYKGQDSTAGCVIYNRNKYAWTNTAEDQGKTKKNICSVWYMNEIVLVPMIRISGRLLVHFLAMTSNQMWRGRKNVMRARYQTSECWKQGYRSISRVNAPQVIPTIVCTHGPQTRHNYWKK